MTDEERARAVVFWIPGLDDEWRNSLVRRISDEFAAVRADERDERAQVVDRHDTGDMQREDMEARRIAAAIGVRGLK